MTGWQLFWLGLAGGLLAEFIAYAEFRRTPRDAMPPWLSYTRYWVIGAGWILVGGVTAAVFVPHHIVNNVAVPIQMGLAAPAVLGVASRSVPKFGIGAPDQGSGTADPSP